MFTISAFADEIDPDPQKQIDVLKQCGVRHIELRSILKTNVLDLTDAQIADLKSLLDRNGFTLSAIGSPIGKIKIDRAVRAAPDSVSSGPSSCARSSARRNIRIFSYYPPERRRLEHRGEDHRKEVFDRMERARSSSRRRRASAWCTRTSIASTATRRSASMSCSYVLPSARRFGRSTIRPTTSSAATIRGRAGR